MAERFDLIVIGAGPGGYVAAIRAAQLGMRVACVEKRDTLGGTCLNVGCIPSKALLDSSELYHLARDRFARHGIKTTIELDLATMLGRKDRIVKELTDGIRFLFKKNRIEGVFGIGRLTSPHAVKVTETQGGERALEADHIILATGSIPLELPFLKFDGRAIVSSTEALAFEEVPEHLVVVGGGYIGLELGSVWHRLGSKVTVIEFLPRIIPMVDTELGNQLFRSLMKQGLAFHLETRVTGAQIHDRRVRVTAENKAGESLSIECDRVLVSVGRKASIAGLGLDEVGVKYDPKSHKIVTDSQFRTSVPSIRAIGDLIEGPMLAHKAEDEGVACAELIAGKAGHVNYETIPSVIYTAPELATVGITEDQAKERGLNFRVGKFPFQINGRAKALDETEGQVKIVADARTDRVLGVHILGPRASDLLAEAVSVMEFGGSSEDIARTCHAHPSLSEVVREAALAVDKRAIHN